MKFVDEVEVRVLAGNGGAGRTSFRQEKFIDRGGPDGGDGGNGGNVIFIASRNQNTLVSFRFHKELTAEHGEPGNKTRKHGRRGKDLRVFVPVGTVITHDGVLVGDLTVDGQECIVAAGGRGGFGNAHFVSSVRQAPKFAEPGEQGEDKLLHLELKLIADVGLVGLPNAGKSTFLSVVSNARPKIADYPFTTLTPNLGVVDIDNTHSMLIADIPGLIEGAAEGKGLGDDFLRHVERTAVIMHFVDAAGLDVVQDYRTILAELKAYKADISTKPQIVVLTKIDTVTPEVAKEAEKNLRKNIPKNTPFYAISAVAHKGIKELLYAASKIVETERQRIAEELARIVEVEAIPVLSLADNEHWTVSGGDGTYEISGGIVDKFAIRTDFSNEESVQRFRFILHKHGVTHELTRRGAVTGDQINLKTGSFEL